jgi:hypothetical protein
MYTTHLSYSKPVVCICIIIIKLNAHTRRRLKNLRAHMRVSICVCPWRHALSSLITMWCLPSRCSCYPGRTVETTYCGTNNTHCWNGTYCYTSWTGSLRFGFWSDLWFVFGLWPQDDSRYAFNSVARTTRDVVQTWCNSWTGVLLLAWTLASNLDSEKSSYYPQENRRDALLLHGQHSIKTTQSHTIKAELAFGSKLFQNIFDNKNIAEDFTKVWIWTLVLPLKPCVGQDFKTYWKTNTYKLFF